MLQVLGDVRHRLVVVYFVGQVTEDVTLIDITHLLLDQELYDFVPQRFVLDLEGQVASVVAIFILTLSGFPIVVGHDKVVNFELDVELLRLVSDVIIDSFPGVFN